MSKTCGDCKHWNVIQDYMGYCCSNVPEYVWIYLKSNGLRMSNILNKDTPAHDCECFTHDEAD